MATLNGGITSNSELIRVSGTLPPPGSYVTIDSEALRINGAARGANGRSFTRDYLAVDRGVAGTTKATHSNGATLTRYYPEAEGGGGGGGVTVTGSQGGSVSGATEFRAAGAVTDLGGGVAGQSLVFQEIAVILTPATPNIINPADNGPLALAIPAGSYARAVPLVSVSFDQLFNLSLTAGTTSAAADPIAYTDLIGSAVGVSVGVAEEAPWEHDTLNNYRNGLSKWFYAIEDIGVYAAFYPSGSDPTTGEVRLLFEIATPAS